MVPQSEIAETVIVSATRAERRIEDEPLRVEVVPEEEVQEKIVMTPGDVSMLLAETNGLRVQTTSPSLGGASVRIQGLNGRYTQVLADGLPLYGSQSGSTEHPSDTTRWIWPRSRSSRGLHRPSTACPRLVASSTSSRVVHVRASRSERSW